MKNRLSAFRKFIIALSKKDGRGKEPEIYAYHLDRLLDVAGDIPIDQVTPEIAQKFRAAIELPDQPLMTAYRMRIMREIFEWAILLKYLKENPFNLPPGASRQ